MDITIFLKEQKQILRSWDLFDMFFRTLVLFLFLRPLRGIHRPLMLLQLNLMIKGLKVESAAKFNSTKSDIFVRCHH